MYQTSATVLTTTQHSIVCCYYH